MGANDGGSWKTPEQAARILGVTTRTLRRWKLAGEGPEYRVQGRRIEYFFPAKRRPAKIAEEPPPPPAPEPVVEQVPLFELPTAATQNAPPKQLEPEPVEEDRFLEFPVIRSRRKTWWLTYSECKRLNDRFLVVDVESEARAALAWIEADPTNRRKTYRGMLRFLTRWMANAKPSPKKRRSRVDPEDAARLGEQFNNVVQFPAEVSRVGR